VGDKIEVRDLGKSFATRHGALPVLDGVSLTVGDGEFVAVVGPSGCGKTTLLNIIAGFEPADRGEVRVDGAPVTRPSPRGIVISQQGSVFPWLTVRRNVLFGLDGRPAVELARLAEHYTALVGLQGFEAAYPYELSGGMLKRLELARALAIKPEILYMDEPLAALDALTRVRMRLELRAILARERPTVLLVTHDVEEAIHLADRVLVLSPRPATIRVIVPVPLPHPRALSSPDALALKERILRELGVDAAPPAA
jgi:ABC-type nitrate/sulfonate/bicarbonate transport system ATPase subunit